MNRRIALCIGIANYAAPELELSNPINDAQRINVALSARGFDTTALLNPTAAELTLALEALKAKISQYQGDQVFAAVFYAGHAIEIGGFGVLMPTDIPYPVCQAGIAHQGVPVLEIVDAMKAGHGPKVVMIDACRTAAEDWDREQLLKFNAWTKQEAARLKDASESDEVAIAYSTTSGYPAYDGSATNSLYCKKLEAALLRHDVTIVDALTQCGQDVIKDTRAKQRPWVYTNLSTKVGFSDLPKYALVSSTTLPGQRGPGTRLHVRAMDDTVAINMMGHLRLLRDGSATPCLDHDESLAAAAVWEDEVLLAGCKVFLSLDTSNGEGRVPARGRCVSCVESLNLQGRWPCRSSDFGNVSWSTFPGGAFGMIRVAMGWRRCCQMEVGDEDRSSLAVGRDAGLLFLCGERLPDVGCDRSGIATGR